MLVHKKGHAKCCRLQMRFFPRKTKGRATIQVPYKFSVIVLAYIILDGSFSL